MRNIFKESDGMLVGSDKTSEGLPWVEFWDKKTTIYFGHDAKRGIQRKSNVLGLDSGCVYGTSAIILFVYLIYVYRGAPFVM
jgi:hypothetical protein